MAFLSLWMSPNAYFKIILMKAATEWKIPCGKQTFISFSSLELKLYNSN